MFVTSFLILKEAKKAMKEEGNAVINAQYILPSLPDQIKSLEMDYAVTRIYQDHSRISKNPKNSWNQQMKQPKFYGDDVEVWNFVYVPGLSEGNFSIVTLASQVQKHLNEGDNRVELELYSFSFLDEYAIFSQEAFKK